MSILNICYHLNGSSALNLTLSQQPYIHLIVNHEIGILRYQQQMPFKKLAVSLCDGLMH